MMLMPTSVVQNFDDVECKRSWLTWIYWCYQQQLLMVQWCYQQPAPSSGNLLHRMTMMSTMLSCWKSWSSRTRPKALERSQRGWGIAAGLFGDGGWPKFSLFILKIKETLQKQDDLWRQSLNVWVQLPYIAFSNHLRNMTNRWSIVAVGEGGENIARICRNQEYQNWVGELQRNVIPSKSHGTGLPFYFGDVDKFVSTPQKKWRLQNLGVKFATFWSSNWTVFCHLLWLLFSFGHEGFTQKTLKFHVRNSPTLGRFPVACIAWDGSRHLRGRCILSGS